MQAILGFKHKNPLKTILKRLRGLLKLNHLNLPIRIEFKFWEVSKDDDSILKEMHMKGLESGTIGQVILHFLEEKDAVVLTHVNDKIGIYGRLEVFIRLEHSVRVYMLREAFKNDKKQ